MKNFLKNLGLDEEISSKILGKHNEVLGGYETSKTELEKQLEQAKAETLARDKQLKELSKIDVDDLQAKLKDYEKSNKELVEKHNSEIIQLKTDYAIEKALTGAKARNLTAAKSLLDLTGLKLDEKGNLTGLEEQIKKLTENESTSFMFERQELPQIKGATIGETSTDGIREIDNVSKMSYAELCNYYENMGGK